jgi:uncharacterized SAM-binding protein YcdF (DUF218 family)
MRWAPLGALARIHWKSVGAGFFVAWLVYVVLQVSTIADWLVEPLLRRSTDGPAEAIVVLGAGYYEPCGLNLHALRRTFRGVELYRKGRAPLLVFTGGRTQTSGEKSIAHEMGNLARSLGVPAENILEETESKTTWENALYTSSLLKSRSIHRVVLVTDSLHMRRAEACFRHFGFEIERASIPQVCVDSSNLEMLLQAFHEYVGSLYYWLKGYTESTENRLPS